MRGVIDPMRHDDPKEIEAALARYVAQALPRWREHRVAPRGLILHYIIKRVHSDGQTLGD